MRSKSQITTLIVAIVLCAPAISAHAARRQSTQSSQVEREEETFVIRSEANGESICRNADANEHRRIINRSANEPARLIYPGAPRKSQLSLPETWTDLLSGLTLQPSAGLRIVLHGTSQLEQNQQAKNAFILAANRWEAIVSTPITVIVDVDFGPNFFGTPFDEDIFGQTASTAVSFPYATVRQSLVSNASDAIEQELYNALPATAVPVEVNGVISDITSVRATIMLARALGLSANISDPSSIPLGQGDSGIGFNSAFAYDFNPDDGISFGLTDFDSVATHEIGHALGFTSRSGQASVTQVSIWDLFRLGRFNTNLGAFPTAPRLMSIGGEHFFFPNRITTFGTTTLELSTGGPDPGPNDGDGRQSSHWKDDELLSLQPYIGVMDPTLSEGLRRTIRIYPRVLSLELKF